MALQDANSLPITQEALAYNLMLLVMRVEGRDISSPDFDGSKISRNVILDAYADCLDAVQGKREVRRPRAAGAAASSIASSASPYGTPQGS